MKLKKWNIFMILILGLLIWNCDRDHIPDSVLNPPPPEEPEEVEEEVSSVEYNFSTTLSGFPVTFVFKLFEDSTYTAGIGPSVLDGGSFSIAGAEITFTAEGNCKIMMGPAPTDAECPDPYTGTLGATTITITNYRGIYGDLDLEVAE